MGIIKLLNNWCISEIVGVVLADMQNVHSKQSLRQHKFELGVPVTRIYIKCYT